MDKTSKEIFKKLYDLHDRYDEDPQHVICAEAADYIKNLSEMLNRRAHPANEPLTLDQLREMDGEPVWIQVLDRPDLSRWHFIVRHPEMGLIAEDGLGQYECYPHNSDQMVFSGCYYDIQHGHNYGVNWLAYACKPEGSENDAKV